MLIDISKMQYLRLSLGIKFSGCQFTVCGQTRQIYVDEIVVLWWNFLLEAPNTHKTPYTLTVNLSDFTVWRHTWPKNWGNCAVLTGNRAGLRTVLSSRLSYRELRSSLREPHSLPSLPADTRMTFQDTQFIQQLSIAWYIPFQLPLVIPHFTFSFLLYG